MLCNLIYLDYFSETISCASLKLRLSGVAMVNEEVSTADFLIKILYVEYTHKIALSIAVIIKIQMDQILT